MSLSDPFDADKFVALWTELLTLQIDLGYYPNAESISFPPPEGRLIDKAICREFDLSSEVISLMKRLPCPSTFDEAWDTPVFNESVAVSFADSTMIRGSRDLENCWIGPDEYVRPDYMNPEDLTLVMEKDESGYHLILDTKANTVRFFEAMMAPCNPWEEEQYQPERPDDIMHYRNYPTRPALEFLKGLVAKFRDLEWIPMNHEGTWPTIIVDYYDEDEEHLNARANVGNILRSQFGWPDNFDKERWMLQRADIWKQVLKRNANTLLASQLKEQDSAHTGYLDSFSKGCFFTILSILLLYYFILLQGILF